MSAIGIARRGDLLIIDCRSVNPQLGVRPALVIQNDADNSRMANTIVAQVTTNTRRSSQITQLLIDEQHVDWDHSGLHRASVINCSNLYTAEQQHIARVIGSLSASTMQHIDDCIKAALSLA